MRLEHIIIYLFIFTLFFKHNTNIDDFQMNSFVLPHISTKSYNCYAGQLQPTTPPPMGVPTESDPGYANLYSMYVQFIHCPAADAALTPSRSGQTCCLFIGHFTAFKRPVLIRLRGD